MDSSPSAFPLFDLPVELVAVALSHASPLSACLLSLTSRACYGGFYSAVAKSRLQLLELCAVEDDPRLYQDLLAWPAAPDLEGAVLPRLGQILTKAIERNALNFLRYFVRAYPDFLISNPKADGFFFLAGNLNRPEAAELLLGTLAPDGVEKLQREVLRGRLVGHLAGLKEGSPEGKQLLKELLNTLSAGDVLRECTLPEVVDVILSNSPPLTYSAEFALNTATLPIYRQHGVEINEDMVEHAIVSRDAPLLRLLLGLGCPVPRRIPIRCFWIDPTESFSIHIEPLLQLLLPHLQPPSRTSLTQACITAPDASFIAFLHEHDLVDENGVLASSFRYSMLPSVLQLALEHDVFQPLSAADITAAYQAAAQFAFRRHNEEEWRLALAHLEQPPPTVLSPDVPMTVQDVRFGMRLAPEETKKEVFRRLVLGADYDMARFCFEHGIFLNSHGVEQLLLNCRTTILGFSSYGPGIKTGCLLLWYPRDMPLTREQREFLEQAATARGFPVPKN